MHWCVFKNADIKKLTYLLSKWQQVMIIFDTYICDKSTEPLALRTTFKLIFNKVCIHLTPEYLEILKNMFHL